MGKIKYDPAVVDYNDECQDANCSLRATVHVLVDEPYPGEPEGTTSLLQMCDGHARAWKVHIADLVIEAHVYRSGGMPCGIEGAVWIEVDNECRMPDEYVNHELAGIEALELTASSA